MTDTTSAEPPPSTMVQPPASSENVVRMEGECAPLDTSEQSEVSPPKRKRRNMFDVRPEDLGEVVVPSVEPLLNDQLKDDGTGELLVGSGSGGFQYRFSEAKKALPLLIREQEEKLAQAKRFAMEQSVQHVLSRQKVVQQADLTTLQSSAQRQRALALMCRTYIGSINFNLDEDAVRASFLPFGPIKMIDLSRDPTTQRHKGFAFVEYELPEAAQLALEQMNNVMMGGRNIKVGRPSNVPQAAPWIEQILDEALKYARIYVSSIHPDLTEQDIKSVFEAFGTIVSCKLAPDQFTGKHKGYGFIEYATQQSATDAITAMNLFDLGGQYIRVGRAITPPDKAKGEKQGPPPAASVLAASAISASIQVQEVVATHGATALGKTPAGSTIPSSDSMQSLSLTNSALSSPQAGVNGSPTVPKVIHPPSFYSPAQSNGSGATATPDERMTLDQQKKKQELLDHKLAGEQNLEREEKLEISGKDARYMMMQKLARISGSGVVVLRNMVTSEEIDDDLEDEISEECSRYGEVSRVVIYQERQGEEAEAEVIVKIFVEFVKSEDAESAKNALNGRWFGGRTIEANIYDEDKYRAQDYTG